MQRGDISIVVIMIGLLIGGLLLFQFADKSPDNSRGLGQECISEPNPGITVTYQGATYYRIKGETAIPLVEVIKSVDSQTGRIYPGHFDRSYSETDSNKYYKSTTSVIFQDARDFLLYVDISNRIPRESRITGFAYFEIYIKDDHGSYKIPDSIRNYCNSSLPVDPKNIIPDANGQSFPPVSFSADKITGAGPGTADVYWLFSYEGVNSESFNVTRDQNSPGILKYTKASGESKTYNTWYNPGAEMDGHLFAIVDTDSTSADSKVAYKYTKLQHLSPFANVPPSSSTFGSPKSLQLRTFSTGNVYPWGWWSPECKPAIYLYPMEKTNVHVQVKPAGFLTYTDPEYPDSGWQVTAYPNGKIISNGKDYEYLYYESKIEDSKIEKPTEGFVVAFNDLPGFYSEILPKLGLNKKETKDFKDYWEKALSKFPYYFVGLMSEASIEKIEPLTVNPKPDSTIRVRIYFKALDKKISVKEPIIITPRRNGYTLVEWGGLVKTDKNHPFTCSQ